MFNPILRLPIVQLFKRTLPILATLATMSDNPTPQTFPTRVYIPLNSHAPFPYSSQDLSPPDSSSDKTFYSMPRLVTHIDDNAIANLRRYYSEVLPRRGRILDFCSSWVSHYPIEVEQAKEREELEVLGTGMNKQELQSNPVLSTWWVQDLNMEPEVKLPPTPEAKGEGRREELDAASCTVSIDYLTKPLEVLSGILKRMKRGGTVHLAVSNRCFPTKAVGRWLRIGESERLNMVGDYLWWSGWRDVEIVTVVEGSWWKDPLWVIRGRKVDEEKSPLD